MGLVTGPILSIDHGDARVGLAISDETASIARPLETIRNRGSRALVAAILERVVAEGIRRVVVGDPVSMDGSEGPRAKKTRRFAARLSAGFEAADIDCPVVLWDESGSSDAALDIVHARGGNLRSEKRRGGLDRLAAAVILQEFLDAGVPILPAVVPLREGEGQS